MNKKQNIVNRQKNKSTENCNHHFVKSIAAWQKEAKGKKTNKKQRELKKVNMALLVVIWLFLALKTFLVK